MPNRLADKVALITGAGGGIGSETARRFAAEGAAVVVNDVDPDAADAVVEQIRAAGGRARAYIADVSSSPEVQAMARAAVEAFGGLDVLVNNAFAKPGDATIASLEEEAWDRTIDVCLKGPFLCTKYALPLMQQRGGGSVITISSVNALRAVSETAYTAAKGGLISMMRLVAAEYGEWNVRSNVICPGSIATDAFWDYWNRFPTGLTELKKMYPLGRIGEPRDIAEYALFLASGESRWVTGTVHTVDGGLMAGRKLEVE